jgi:hypothetical protein
MKALPLWQPWATLVAIGAKRVETRDYPPERIGLRAGQRIAIHATKTTRGLPCCELPFFADRIPDPSALPLGALVATCTLSRAAQITAERAEQLLELNPQEYAFGLYTLGRWAWVLSDVEQLPEPVPFRGSQGAFDVPDDLLDYTPPTPIQGALL